MWTWLSRSPNQQNITSKEYVGSGGRNASLAAILEGQGGQQKRQHISLKLSPIPFIMLYWSLRKILSSETLRAHWFDREFYSETKYSCLNLRMHFIFKSHNQCSKVVQVWVWSGAVNESRSASQQQRPWHTARHRRARDSFRQWCHGDGDQSGLELLAQPMGDTSWGCLPVHSHHTTTTWCWTRMMR